MNYDEIAKKQCEHWNKLASEHAGTFQAVGGETKKHKTLRYSKVLRLIEGSNDFTIHEIGPGVGDLYEYLKHYFSNINFSYSASEITQEYCDIMRKSFPEINLYLRNVLTEQVNETYDFVVLSGVFHQQGQVRHREWWQYMKGLLDVAWLVALKGIAFNVLTADADFYKPGNYYADLTELHLHITRNYSRFYYMDRVYPLFETTFCVYKPDHIRELYPQREFRKYLKDECGG